jgi:hypothetical protein
LQGKSHTNIGTGYPILLNPLGGNIGVNKTNPAYAVDVAGDVNVSGAFRVNGVALVTSGGQTPWLTNIDGNQKDLTNAAHIEVRSLMEHSWFNSNNQQLRVDVTDAFAADIGPTIGFGGPSGSGNVPPGSDPFFYALIAGRKEGTSPFFGYLSFITTGASGIAGERMRINSQGYVFMYNLPTSSPGSGGLWNSGGTLRIG